jgi:hypothetical protein
MYRYRLEARTSGPDGISSRVFDEDNRLGRKDVASHELQMTNQKAKSSITENPLIQHISNQNDTSVP